jgi:hypothetical protein
MHVIKTLFIDSHIFVLVILRQHFIDVEKPNPLTAPNFAFCPKCCSLTAPNHGFFAFSSLTAPNHPFLF